MVRRRASPYRVTYTSEWHPWAKAGLSLAAHGLLSFLRSSPCTTRLPGLVAAGSVVIAWDLRVSPDDVDKALAELIEAGFAYPDPGGRVIFLPGILDLFLPRTEHEAMGMARALVDLPPCEAVGKWLLELVSLAKSDGKKHLVNALTGNLESEKLASFPGVKDDFPNHWPDDLRGGRAGGRAGSYSYSDSDSDSDSQDEEALEGGRVQEGRGEERELEGAWEKTGGLPDLGDLTAQLQDLLRTGDDGNAEALIQNAPLDLRPDLTQYRTMFMSRAAATPANEGI